MTGEVIIRGRRTRAVFEAYAETGALGHHCPNCHAKVGEFCRHDAESGGGERKVPCPRRIIAASQATTGAAEP
ncbi:hypothetical protein [Mycobacterium canetti]|uniref:zinc finger domain-containing protein n=1 Tax=Mycobacterium canetti TaxID=78331 RepID=UPI00034807AD|nr:hypothetical protein [Mycobacterium canetti]